MGDASLQRNRPWQSVGAFIRGAHIYFVFSSPFAILHIFSLNIHLVCLANTTVFFGSTTGGLTTAGMDMGVNVDAVFAFCDYFSNATLVELPLGVKQYQHIKYEPNYQLLYWTDGNNVHRGLVSSNTCFHEVILNKTIGIGKYTSAGAGEERGLVLER